MKHKSSTAIPHKTPTKMTESVPDLQEQIRLRAYGLYKQRETDGHDVDDWLQAESEVTKQQVKTVIA
jgi:hypothetical protein